MPFPPSSTIPFRPHLLKHVLPNAQRRATTSRSISLQSFRPSLSASTGLDQSRNATYKARGTGSQFPLRVGPRGFRTTAKRELPFATLAFSTFGVLKSSAALAAIVAGSRIVLTLLPFAAVKAVRLRAKRKWHETHFARLNTPPHIVRFYYDKGMYVEEPIQPDCNDWKDAKGPNGRSWKENIKGRGIRWPPWGKVSLDQGEKVIKIEPLRSKEEMYDRVYNWVINTSRERTGLPPLERPAQGSGNPFKRWHMFYLPKASLNTMKEIKEMSLHDKEKLYDLRRYLALEKLIASRMRKTKWIFVTLVWLPIALFAIVAAFSLERVPFTGRWRMIMLSPEEEDNITAKLKGPGWYKSVLTMFTTAESPAPPMVPVGDWRWGWVNGVLRRLERGVEEHCKATREGREMVPIPSPFTLSGSGITQPPPPSHPLHPRARVTSRLHTALEGHSSGKEHLEVGPPYSLLLLDNEERNAMSYGFGDGGSGGVVVYTGILDEILSGKGDGGRELEEERGVVMEQQQVELQPAESRGFFASLFTPSAQTITRRPTSNRSFASQPEPTEEQTLQLALVLAHELSHLVLSHHLESLSWSEIVVPSAAGLGGDILRTIFYPLTIFLGPFVNDAINDITKKKAEETTAYSDVHFSIQQEREADVVSLRLLAYAGYDPQLAVKYWSHSPQPACTKSGQSSAQTLPFQFLRGGVHDERDSRFQRLLEELERWRTYARTKLGNDRKPEKT